MALDKNHLAFELGRLGLLPAALEDALHRAEAYFSVRDYTLDEAARWCQAQPKEAAHLFGPLPAAPAEEDEQDYEPWEALGWPEAVWRTAAPSTKLAAWRTFEAEVAKEEGGTPDPKPRRPQPVPLSPVQQQELAALPPTQRLMAYRTMQAEAGKGG